jgi:hypothetical protein
MNSSNTNGLCKPVVISLDVFKKALGAYLPLGQHTQTAQALTHTQCPKRQPSCLFQTSNDLPAAREGCCASW